jgi:hypothetical protein
MLRRNFLQFLGVVPLLPLVGKLPPAKAATTYKSSRYTLLISPEALEDIRNWVVDQIDEKTRREIYCAGPARQMFSVTGPH